MKIKNIFKKILKAIMLFISTIIGREQRILTYRLIDISGTISKTLKEIELNQTQQFLKMMNQIVLIRKKAYYPIAINHLSKAINLAIQRDLKADVRYEPVQNYLYCELFADKDLFDKYRLDLEASYKDHPAKPLMKYANELLIERKLGLTNKISLVFIFNILKYSNQKEVILHHDLMELLSISLMESVKDEYVLKNNLQDFDLQKGAIEKQKEEPETLD